MQQRQQERPESEQATAIDERLSVALEENQLLREQVESWRKLTQSLELELQETQQELEFTNQDLRNALKSNQLEFEQAIELAQTILKRKKSAGESLAQLLTAIYGRAIKQEELKQIESSSIRTTPLISAEVERIVDNLKEVRTRSKQLQAQYKELQFQFISFKVAFVELWQLFDDFITEKRENNKDFNNHFESNVFNYSSSPPKKKRLMS